MVRANSEKVWDPQDFMAHVSLGGSFLANKVQLSIQVLWEGRREVTDRQPRGHLQLTSP